MKNDGTTTILNWVLGASLLISLVLCFQDFNQTRALRSLRQQAALSQFTLQNNRAFFNLLFNEAKEYGAGHPAINPILESIGPKAAGATPAGATKPASK